MPIRVCTRIEFNEDSQSFNREQKKTRQEILKKSYLNSNEPDLTVKKKAPTPHNLRKQLTVSVHTAFARSTVFEARGCFYP